MTATPCPNRTARLALHAETAADLMTPNPVSIRADASVRDAVALLADRGFSGAPVIDEAGRAVGVVTQTDLLIREREGTGFVPAVHADPDRPGGRAVPAEYADPRAVADVMTPGMFAVTPETPAAQVVADMTALRVHRMFVLDKDGTLVGVISSFDILRHLRPEAQTPCSARRRTALT